MFYQWSVLGSQTKKLALETWLNHATLIKSLNRCCISGWRGNVHALTLGSNCIIFWMCISTLWNVFIIHLRRKVGRGVVLPSPPVRKLKSLITWKWQLLTNYVSTGAVKPWEEVMPPLWMIWVWQKVTLDLEELLCFLRNAAECAAGETKFYCLTFPAEVEKLSDNCVILFMGDTVNSVPLYRLLCSCVVLSVCSVPNVLLPVSHTVGSDCQRLHSFICITALCFLGSSWEPSTNLQRQWTRNFWRTWILKSK